MLQSQWLSFSQKKNNTLARELYCLQVLVKNSATSKGGFTGRPPIENSTIDFLIVYFQLPLRTRLRANPLPKPQFISKSRSIKKWPQIAARRNNKVQWAKTANRLYPSLNTLNETFGFRAAYSFTKDTILAAVNFDCCSSSLRTGRERNNLDTLTLVPLRWPPTRYTIELSKSRLKIYLFLPDSITRWAICDKQAMAFPLKPCAPVLSTSRCFEVRPAVPSAANSSLPMPTPSSSTWRQSRPSWPRWTTTPVAPASNEFSTSSLTICSGPCREQPEDMAATSSLSSCRIINQYCWSPSRLQRRELQQLLSMSQMRSSIRAASSSTLVRSWFTCCCSREFVDSSQLHLRSVSRTSISAADCRLYSELNLLSNAFSSQLIQTSLR